MCIRDRASKGTVNKWLGYAYDIYVILFEHALVDNGFLLIAGKSGIFPDQYHLSLIHIFVHVCECDKGFYCGKTFFHEKCAVCTLSLIHICYVFVSR